MTIKMQQRLLLCSTQLLLLLLLYACTCSHVTLAKLSKKTTIEFIDPSLPPDLSKQSPKCSVIALKQEFRGTSALLSASVPSSSPSPLPSPVPSPGPASSGYTQPTECPAPWTGVVLELLMTAQNTHKNCIASVFINGGEVLRTSIPIAPKDTIASWTVRKDVSRYSSLLRNSRHRNTSVSMMIEGSEANPNAIFTSKVTVHFFRGARTISSEIKGLYRHPANFIIPITKQKDMWFRISNSVEKTTMISIPRNTYRAVLEILVSYHGEDELWYTNPLRPSTSYTGNGGLRQVYATIDGKFAGGHIPFPVIYPGSINNYLWSPVTAIGALDMPSYSFELTPLLHLLLDGRPHKIGLGVEESLQYWLLSANLHLWIDNWSDVVHAGILDYRAPPLKLTKQASWQNGDGSSVIDGDGLLRFVGWVSSSKGNLTVIVRQKITFKSQVQVQNRGATRRVDMINKERLMVGVEHGSSILGRVEILKESPMQIQTSSEVVAGGAKYESTKLFHQFDEMVNLNDNRMNNAVMNSLVSDRQDVEGSAVLRRGTAVWGSGSSKSSYKFRDDDVGCYGRNVDAEFGMVKLDVATRSCVADA